MSTASGSTRVDSSAAELRNRQSFASSSARDDVRLEMGLLTSGSNNRQISSSLTQPAGRFIECTADPDVKKLDERLSAYFKKATMMINVLLPLTFLLKMLYHEHTMTWNVVAFSGLAISSFLLNFAGMQSAGRIQISESGLTPTDRSNVEWLCCMVYISVILLMLTAFALLVFFDMMHGLIAIPLVPVPALLAFLFCRKLERKNASEEEKKLDFWGLGHIKGAARYWTNYEMDLKLYSNFSVEVVAAAFTGLSGTILGYVKSPPHQPVGVRAAECFLFYGIVLGLLVALLTLVPPVAEWEDTQLAVVKLHIRMLAYAMLLFVILGGVMAAVEILQGFVILALCPDILIAIAWFFKEYKDGARSLVNTERTAASREAAAERSLSLFVIYSTLFMALMASYSTHAGSGKALSLPFKLFVLATLCAVVTYLSRIVLVLEDPEKESSAFAKWVSAGAMYVAAAIAVVCAVVVLVRHPEELKNII